MTGRRSKPALETFQKRLLAWFHQNRRDLPWRRTRNAYRVWISETMLQQTRAAAAIPFYRRFLRTFPSLQALARARPDAVLRAWSGLGYYCRARNLHRAAKIILHRHGGRFPRELEEALALAGVGAYTARAVLSIAYAAPLAALDGNVARVIARREAIEGDLRAPKRWKRLQALADAWLEHNAPGDWNQAMMELGATICTPRRPRCGACPVRPGCRGFELGIADRLPSRGVERPAVRLSMAAAVPVDRKGRTLLARGADESAIFSGLWQFPALEGGGSARERLERYLAKAFGIHPKRWEPLPPIRHAVTFREITLEGWLVQVQDLAPAPGGLAGRARVVALHRVTELAVSSATRKLAESAIRQTQSR
ncbi:MAG TPA: A/G-specific adenine glycosylase [Candidatus Acidoferrales bacterium]|nr:A/G-specific adenine glycosylase [Candidatus Acidoferrales bacterium]